jgi:hypothetical protein
MSNDFGVTGHLAELLDPTLRDKVVMERQQAGLGKERYGVVCGIIDPETRERCNKRICPQGRGFALANPGTYCLHDENYNPDTHEDITVILGEHGLTWRPLKTKTSMKEATDKTKKRKRKKRNGKLQVTEHGTDARYGTGEPRPPSLFRANDPEAWKQYQEAKELWERQHPSLRPDAESGPASGTPS